MISEGISDDIPLKMKTLNMIIRILNAFLQSCLKLKRCKLHKATCHPTKCDKINDVKLFRKFLTLSNQMLHYKSKCIRISYNSFVKLSL